MATDIAIDLPATAEPETRSRTRRLPFIIGAILVIALGTWGVRRYLYGRNHVSTDNAQVDGHITAISPRIAGFVDRVLVDENQRVKPGDTLVVLDRPRPRRTAGTGRGGSAHRAGGGGLAAQRRPGCGPAPGHAGAGRVGAGGRGRGGSGLSARPAPTTSATAGSPRPRSSRRSSSTQARRADAGGGQPRGRAPAGRRRREPGLRLRRRAPGRGRRLAAAQSAVDNARLQLGYATLLAPSSGVVAQAKRGARGAGAGRPEPAVHRARRQHVWVTAN